MHSAPVAARLARDPTVEVTALVDTAETAAALGALFARLDAPAIPIRVIAAPAWVAGLARIIPDWSAMKLARLYAVARLFRSYDALVTPERTSTILKRLPGRKPLMIHIPHGAGDRARGFEPRIRLFDLVIVAGEKDRRRMIDEGLVTPERCVSSGYVKLGAVARLCAGRATRLFANDRPVVLYNPHFDPELSSWPRFGRQVIAAFAAQDRYDLVVAPHVRLFANASPAERAELETLAIPDRILIDLGSPRSSDMTYTMGADIYLGDVSSQVYEFVSRPRPCLFLDAHASPWTDNPNYACWSFGSVIMSAQNIVGDVDEAVAMHVTREALQRAAAVEAMGDPARAAEVAADAILAALRVRRSAGVNAS